MENGQTKITFKIEKTPRGFYTTTIYQNDKVMGYIDTATKSVAVKATSSQKKLQEQIKICQIFR
jgi:hypothetical protein